MKNTLIIGVAGAGKTKKLKELLHALPKEVRITLCEVSNHENQEFRHHDTVELLNADSVQTTVAMTKMLVQKPSVLVMEELHHYTNIDAPYDIPVYATMQVATIEEAKRTMARQQITIPFEEIIVCPQYHQGVTVEASIMGGATVITNTRVPVSTVIAALKEGVDFEGICEDYDLTKQQIVDALTYVEKLLGT